VADRPQPLLDPGHHVSGAEISLYHEELVMGSGGDSVLLFRRDGERGWMLYETVRVFREEECEVDPSFTETDHSADAKTQPSVKLALSRSWLAVSRGGERVCLYGRVAGDKPGWKLAAAISAPNAEIGFGASLALGDSSSGLLAVGAPAGPAGAVFTYIRLENGTWGLQEVIGAPEGSPAAGFGRQVAFGGGGSVLAVAGQGVTSSEGALFLFTSSSQDDKPAQTGMWVPGMRVLSSRAHPSIQAGFHLAASGSEMITVAANGVSQLWRNGPRGWSTTSDALLNDSVYHTSPTGLAFHER
jgi:hypothetical protein